MTASDNRRKVSRLDNHFIGATRRNSSLSRHGRSYCSRQKREGARTAVEIKNRQITNINKWCVCLACDCLVVPNREDTVVAVLVSIDTVRDTVCELQKPKVLQFALPQYWAWHPRPPHVSLHCTVS